MIRRPGKGIPASDLEVGDKVSAEFVRGAGREYVLSHAELDTKPTGRRVVTAYWTRTDGGRRAVIREYDYGDLVPVMGVP